MGMTIIFDKSLRRIIYPVLIFHLIFISVADSGLLGKWGTKPQSAVFAILNFKNGRASARRQPRW